MGTLDKIIMAATSLLGVTAQSAEAQETQPAQGALISTEEETRDLIGEPEPLQGPIALSSSQFFDEAKPLLNAFETPLTIEEPAVDIAVQAPREPADRFDGNTLKDSLNVDLPLTRHGQLGVVPGINGDVVGIGWSSNHQPTRTEDN